MGPALQDAVPPHVRHLAALAAPRHCRLVEADDVAGEDAGTGRVAAALRTGSASPLCSSIRMQSGIALWPGSTTRSARSTTAASLVTTTSASGATCMSALATERRLPIP